MLCLVHVHVTVNYNLASVLNACNNPLGLNYIYSHLDILFVNFFLICYVVFYQTAKAHSLSWLSF